ncbi:MAG: phage tail protein [Cyanobacteria bacterium P01_F01_bin.86]
MSIFEAFLQPSEVLLASRFFIRLELQVTGGNAIADATFLECQGFERTQDCISITEVTPKQWAKASRGQVAITKIPGNAKTTNLVLRRGLTNSKLLWNWFKEVEVGNWYDNRAEGSLSIYDQAGIEQARYNFEGAWPMRYQASGMSARSSEIEIEELELATEYLVRAA